MSARERHQKDAVFSHLGAMISVAAALGVLSALLVLPALWAGSYGVHVLDAAVRATPTQLIDEPLPQQTRVLDADGQTIAVFYDQDRVNVPLDGIAPVMQQAIIAVEDSRFYQHGAIDLKGTLRAFLLNQTGASTQGGSSITQQMAKMTALAAARTPAERKAATQETYLRKVQELRRAIAYEQHYSKDWILDRYLNLAYFGSGSYGIQAAAQHYFSVNAKDLTPAQAALLAGLVQNPVGYDPTRNPDKATARRHLVLQRMVETGVVKQADAEAIDKQPLGLKVSNNPSGCISSTAPFFCEYVHRTLLADPDLGKTVTDRQQLLNGGGLTIQTTLKSQFQQSADAAAQASVRPTDAAVGALAMVEPGSGNVEALAQSRPMGTDATKGQTFLNYTVDKQFGDAAGFQPGSTFKLFTLTAGLTEGLPATTTFDSPPQISLPQNQFRTCSGPYPNKAPWQPQNSTSSGAMTMYTGMQQSVNTYFAQLERQTGLCLPTSFATQMGVALPPSNGGQVPSFTLGVSDANPLEMAAAYATMPARGKYCPPHAVNQILNSDGKVFKAYATACKQVVDPGVADRVNDILRGVIAPGGFGEALTLDKPAAGKTGTSESNQAVWFNGYTPAVATSAVVAGVDQAGHPTTLNNVALNGVNHGTAHGATVAGPMWALAMRAIQDLMPGADFTPPPPPPAQAGLPGVSGQSPGVATAAIQAAGFTPALAGVVDWGGTPGTVAAISLGVDLKTVYIFTTSGSGAPPTAPAAVPPPQPQPQPAPAPPPPPQPQPQPQNPQPPQQQGDGKKGGHGG